MLSIEDILSIRSEGAFCEAALEVFAFQAEHCAPYKEYLSLIGRSPQEITEIEQIPFLPIEFFKSRKIYCSQTDPGITFTSSTTGGNVSSCHYIARVSDYEKTFRTAFELNYGNVSDTGIYALLPGYLERQGSSLVYMVNDLIQRSHGGFYLSDTQKLVNDLKADKGPKILFGVSYALLDLAQNHPLKLENTIVMETGGMKGKREEITKQEFHKILCNAFGVGTIHSEYGMAELTSQAYSKGSGYFHTPPWMKVLIRDLNDPLGVLPNGQTGGMNIIDLANLSSCAFIETSDLGIINSHNTFSILGRADRSEIRGCNLLVQ